MLLVFMRSPFRYYHICEILNHYELQKQPLDRFIQKYFRFHKSIGSKDRQEIAQTVYVIFRHKGLIDSFCTPPITWEKRIEEYSRAIFFRHLDDPSLPPHIRTSFPLEYYQFFVDAYGIEKAEQIAKTCNTPAPITIRVNPLKTSRENLLNRLKSWQGICCSESPLGITFSKRIPFSSLEEFKKGFFEVQDEGSQLMSFLVNPSLHHQVLDYCAGGGGKTLAFGPCMQNQGQIYLYDTRQKALLQAKKRLKRAGIQNVQFLTENHLKRLLHKMDIVLLDVPCSGSGTLRRNPDMKWKFSSSHLTELVQLQRSIFHQGFSYAKQSGTIIYMTCSILPQENKQQVDYFLQHYPLSLEKTYGWLPQENGKDGFFASVFTKMLR
ncbi:MAG: RsmB/NOP family class I SAM-dependent RNA methyltransferase [Parachlamydiales bacterium]|nr:RsmB/NOP family class I SAM-dependent RNA methyltransferase [Parachlamydiales bacterium]